MKKYIALSLVLISAFGTLATPAFAASNDIRRIPSNRSTSSSNDSSIRKWRTHHDTGTSHDNGIRKWHRNGNGNNGGVAGGGERPIPGRDTTTDDTGVVDQTNPRQPTNLVADVVNNRVHLTWDDNSNNESSFWVMRSKDRGEIIWTTVAKLPANTTSYTDTSAIEGQTYFYRIRANRADGSTHSWSNLVFLRGDRYGSGSDW